MRPIELIPLFDKFLADRKKKFKAIVIGSGALSLLKTIDRETKDIDIIDPKIPQDILNVAIDFALEMEKQGTVLQPDWFNNGPITTKDRLPKEWEKRTEEVYKGKALTVYVLGRPDLLKTKIQGLCDRGLQSVDKQDCIAMKPTKKELLEAYDWLKTRYKDPSWDQHVKSTLEALAGDLGFAL